MEKNNNTKRPERTGCVGENRFSYKIDQSIKLYNDRFYGRQVGTKVIQKYTPRYRNTYNETTP